jgi:hypothetical protein
MPSEALTAKVWRNCHHRGLNSSLPGTLRRVRGAHYYHRGNSPSQPTAAPLLSSLGLSL